MIYYAIHGIIAVLIVRKVVCRIEKYLISRLWLAIGLGPGNRRVNKLLEKYIFPETVFDAFQSGERLELMPQEIKSLKSVTLSQIEYLYNSCVESGIKIYTPEDDAFPRTLLEIDNPPNVLFSYGRLEDIHINPSVAIIGARDADDYSLSAAEILSARLSEQEVTVISGFARGIDTAAHNGALNAGGKTIAVLGCGIKYDYPRHSGSFKERVAQNGAVISEYFPSASPERENFKVRNRIVSGLSNGILVIQAGERSGTLNTVSHAISQGRDIFVLPPHDIFSDKYKGNCGLLRDGAIPVYSYKDIINSLTAL